MFKFHIRIWREQNSAPSLSHFKLPPSIYPHLVWVINIPHWTAFAPLHNLELKKHTKHLHNRSRNCWKKMHWNIQTSERSWQECELSQLKRKRLFPPWHFRVQLNALQKVCFAWERNALAELSLDRWGREAGTDLVFMNSLMEWQGAAGMLGTNNQNAFLNASFW